MAPRFNDDGRGSQAILLEDGDRRLLVDAGPTLMREWPHARLRPVDLDAVLFTHLHGDHIAGWPFFLLHRIFRGTGPSLLRAVGPEGLRRQLERLVDVCYPELEPGTAFKLDYQELAIEPASYDLHAPLGALRVEPMLHSAASLGYRLDWAGSSVAITGDTAWCEGLERLLDRVDLALVECTNVDAGMGRHLGLEQLREHRSRLTAKRIVLVHLSDAVARALAVDPIPGVEAAYDGWFTEWEKPRGAPLSAVVDKP